MGDLLLGCADAAFAPVSFLSARFLLFPGDDGSRVVGARSPFLFWSPICVAAGLKP
ncbi:unnamed protein product [Urochloa humidicola]